MMQGQAISSLLWFAAIVVAIPVVLWLLKRSPLGGGATGAAGGSMRIVGALALSPSQRIVTVEVGEGAARCRLVLGVTPQQICTLHQLPPGAEPPAEVPAAAAFSQVLSKLRGADRP